MEAEGLRHRRAGRPLEVLLVQWSNGESLKVISRRLAIAVRPDTAGTESEQTREHAHRVRVQTLKSDAAANLDLRGFTSKSGR